jgi:hypothetical protein
MTVVCRVGEPVRVRERFHEGDGGALSKRLRQGTSHQLLMVSCPVMRRRGTRRGVHVDGPFEGALAGVNGTEMTQRPSDRQVLLATGAGGECAADLPRPAGPACALFTAGSEPRFRMPGQGILKSRHYSPRRCGEQADGLNPRQGSCVRRQGLFPVHLWGADHSASPEIALPLFSIQRSRCDRSAFPTGPDDKNLASTRSS